MVKLLSKENSKKIAGVIYRIFHMQEFFTHIVEVNRPEITPCLFACWHAHQMCSYGIVPINKLHVLISRSRDGDIIADVSSRMGFKSVRGSKGKQGAVEASMQMISILTNEKENCIMTVDGPKGPPKVAKGGIVKIAKLAHVPIVPVYWYSTNFNFVTFPSWDKLRMPLFDVNLINFYGDPIYVNEEDDEEEKRLEVQRGLEYLEEKAPEVYNEVYWLGRWKKKRSDSSLYRWNP